MRMRWCVKERGTEKERKVVIAIEKLTENERGIEIATGIGSMMSLSGKGSGNINIFNSSIDSYRQIGSIKSLSGRDYGIINTYSSSIDSHRHMVVAVLPHLKGQVLSHNITIMVLPTTITIIDHHHHTTTTMWSTITILRLPCRQEVSEVLQSSIVQGLAGTMIVVVLHSYIQVRVNRILQKSFCILRVTNLLLNLSYILESESENRGLGKVQMSNIIIHHPLHMSIANVNVNAII